MSDISEATIEIDSLSGVEVTVEQTPVYEMTVSVMDALELAIDVPAVYEMAIDLAGASEITVEAPTVYELALELQDAIELSVVAGGESAAFPMDDLTDVDSTTIVNGQTLVYQNGRYIPGFAGENEVSIQNDQPTDGSEIWVDWDDNSSGSPGTPGSYEIVTRIDQPTPAAEWVLDIGRLIGAVRVEDSAGSDVLPGGIQTVGNVMTLTFSAPFSGTAWVTG